jgi:hypothetical protein
MHLDPTAAHAVQTLFQALMSVRGDSPSSFSAAIPASLVFGWGGAAAGMFSAIAWQARMGSKRITVGFLVGTLAGLASWSLSILLVGNKLGWLFYIEPVQGAILGLFAFLFFRGNGMPLLVAAAAVAGAWTGDFVRMVTAAFSPSLGYLLPITADSFWTGTLARLEFILLPAIFIHLAIWIAWKTKAYGTVDRADSITAPE